MKSRGAPDAQDVTNREKGEKMLFIGGISSGSRQIANEYIKTVICSRCGAYGRYQIFMTYMYFSFFFIPLFRWNKRFYVKMSCCGAVYELDPEVGRRLLRGEGVDIAESDLSLVQDGNRPSYGERREEEQAALAGTVRAEKRCPNCGYETAEEFAYCPKCGTRLED